MQNESIFGPLVRALHDMCNNGYSFTAGVFASAIGYLIPVRDIVHLLLLFFLLDVLFGYWAARKIRGERFSVQIIWNQTMPRMLISIVLIIGAFMWDSVYKQDFVSTYKIVGWFISGVLLYSIAENGYAITKWSVFPQLGNLFKNKVGEQTGLNVSSDNDNKENIK